jgi:alpha-D-ribose 1-methylphosphonate 5-triphosphate synthase subunit PhnH
MTAVETLRETMFDPAFRGEALLDRLLEATSAPGHVVPLGELGLQVPPPNLRPACALLLARLDRDVSFAVLGLAARWVREYLRFNTGALIADVEAADFVLVTGPGPIERLDRVKRARRGAFAGRVTVVYAVTSLSGEPDVADTRLVVSGRRGVGDSTLCVRGIRPEEVDRLASYASSSLGVDVWLTAADGTLAVLPRSVRWRRVA